MVYTVRPGLNDEDEETPELTDKNCLKDQYGQPQTVKLAEQILKITKDFISSIEQSYNKYYIGFGVVVCL
jgi:hypothetical protein